MIRSTLAPATLVYGETAVGGVVTYANVKRTTYDKDLYILLSHCVGPIESIGDLYYEDTKITSSQINSSGRVISGKYGRSNTESLVVRRDKLGSPLQQVQSRLSSVFGQDWTTNHRGRGIASTLWRMRLHKTTVDLYQGTPANLRAVIKGVKVYDPRKDSTNGGTGAHRFTTPSTWQWTDNPVLCTVDYLTRYVGIGSDRIDWAHVRAQAAICDVLVAIPGNATEKRYRCDGALSLGAPHKENIAALLSSCLGKLVRVSGKWRVYAGAYDSTAVPFNESDIFGTIRLATARPKSERYNSLGGVYYSREHDYTQTDFPARTDATYKARDGREIAETLELPFVSRNTQAQRIAEKRLHIDAQKETIEIPCRWTGLKLTPMTRISLTYPRLNYTNKIFRVIDLKVGSDEAPVTVIAQGDSAAAWADLAADDYHTEAGGTITLAEDQPAAPSSLVGTGAAKGINWKWTLPDEPIDAVRLYTSSTANWSDATLSWEGLASSAFESLTGEAPRYAWVRTVYKGKESLRLPNSDTSSISASPLVALSANDTLNNDPFFADPHRNWFSLGTNHTEGALSSNFESVEVSDGEVGFMAVRHDAASSDYIFSNLIPISAQGSYRLSVWARQESSTPLNYLVVAFCDASGANISISTSNATGWTTLSLWHYWKISNQPFGTSWTHYEFNFGEGSDATIPNGAVACRIGALINYSQSPAEEIDLQAYRLLSRHAGNRIVSVYRRSRPTPATPTGDGIPTGWSAYRPAPDGSPLWESRAEQSQWGVTQGSWSKPRLIAGSHQAHNLLDSLEWSVGTTGSQGRFVRNGAVSKNAIVLGGQGSAPLGPFGDIEPLWECRPDAASSADGGWKWTAAADDIYFDPKRSYRYSVWVRVNSLNGSLYLGCRGNHVETLSGSVHTNPYFIGSSWSSLGLTANKWYLLVGVVWGAGYTGSDQGIAGIYDPSTGDKVSDGTEYRFRYPTTNEIQHRAYHYFNTVTTTRQWFARPRLEAMEEAGTLSQLLAKDGEDGAGFEIIFRRTTTSTAPSTPTTTAAQDATDEHVPTNWSDDQQGVSSSYPYEWAAKRTGSTRNWGKFAAPKIWATWQKGDTGNLIRAVYRRSGTTPSTPTGNGVPTGWSLTWPNQNGLPLWVSRAEQTAANVTVGSWSPPRISVPAQQKSNLLDILEWKVGTTGNQGRFMRNGNAAENAIVLGGQNNNPLGPYGDPEPLWECRPDATSDADGGWYWSALSSDIYFDRGRAYRYSVWVRIDRVAGYLYLGAAPNQVENLNATYSVNSNPYFIGVTWSSLGLSANQWYLLVGVVWGAGFTGGDQGIAGIYDPRDGTRVINFSEYRFRATTTQIVHRAYHYTQYKHLHPTMVRPPTSGADRGCIDHQTTTRQGSARCGRPRVCLPGQWRCHTHCSIE